MSSAKVHSDDEMSSLVSPDPGRSYPGEKIRKKRISSVPTHKEAKTYSLIIGRIPIATYAKSEFESRRGRTQSESGAVR